MIIHLCADLERLLFYDFKEIVEKICYEGFGYFARDLESMQMSRVFKYLGFVWP